MRLAAKQENSPAWNRPSVPLRALRAIMVFTYLFYSQVVTVVKGKPCRQPSHHDVELGNPHHCAIDYERRVTVSATDLRNSVG